MDVTSVASCIPLSTRLLCLHLLVLHHASSAGQPRFSPAGHVVLARSCAIQPRLLNHDILTALIGSFDSLEPQLCLSSRPCLTRSGKGEVGGDRKRKPLLLQALPRWNSGHVWSLSSVVQLNQNLLAAMFGFSRALNEALKACETTTFLQSKRGILIRDTRVSPEVLRSVFVLFFLMASQLRHGLRNEFSGPDRHRKPVQALRPYVPSGLRSPACLPKCCHESGGSCLRIFGDGPPCFRSQKA